MKPPRPTRETATAVRQLDAFKLRLDGYSFAEIADRLGIVRSEAHRLVNRELTAIRAETTTNAKRLRRIEVARLDRWLSKLAPRIEEGDPAAITTAARLAERRAKLLGLDAPEQHEHSGTIGIASADDLLAKLGDAAGHATEKPSE